MNKKTEKNVGVDGAMRINKYLAHKGYSTRTGADEMIQKHMVTINGRFAVLGDKVTETDVVVVKRSKKPEKFVYFAYNKPVGVITHSPQDGEKDIKSSLKKETEKSELPSDIFPVGRLDKNSHGLLILTNDGRVTDRLLNPVHAHDKEYIVKTTNKLTSNFKKIMEGGVLIEGYKTAPCQVVIRGEKEFSITLSEGKKHQIRRMVVALRNDVTDLKRVRVMNILLGKIPKGGFRKIEGEELETFLYSLGL